MKVVVTGGAGFIGSNFIRYWMRNHPGDDVVNFDALTYAGHIESLKDLEGNPHYSFIKGDITDPHEVKDALRTVDLVVHFAAESHVDRSVLDPLVFVKTNVLGTATLLNAALELKIQHFHHISTDEVFGQLGPNDPPFHEQTPINPRTPYSSSKAASDLLALSYYEAYGLPVTLTNCSNNYGPFQDTEKLIPRFITNLIMGEKVPLMGNGENIRDWLHVEDHCRAIDLVIHSGIHGERYCVGGNEERTNREVTFKILDLLGKDASMIEHVGHRLGHDFRYAINSHKLQSLGWKPQYSFDDGLEQTVNWYKDNEWWWKPLREGRPIVDRAAQKGYTEIV
jgi:dTDP-glucose 4,6-dehydratase